jgi:hypothetical protein
MSQIVGSTPNRRPTRLQAGGGRPCGRQTPAAYGGGYSLPSAQPPLTARRRSAMSEMRPVTDKEVRDAAERLRQTRCRAGWWDEHAATAPARHPGRHRTCLRAGTEDRAARPLFSPAGSWRPRLRQGPEAPLRGGTWRVGMNRALPRNARALTPDESSRRRHRCRRGRSWLRTRREMGVRDRGLRRAKVVCRG